MPNFIAAVRNSRPPRETDGSDFAPPESSDTGYPRRKPDKRHCVRDAHTHARLSCCCSRRHAGKAALARARGCTCRAHFHPLERPAVPPSPLSLSLSLSLSLCRFLLIPLLFLLLLLFGGRVAAFRVSPQSARGAISMHKPPPPSFAGRLTACAAAAAAAYNDWMQPRKNPGELWPRPRLPSIPSSLSEPYYPP